MKSPMSLKAQLTTIILAVSLSSTFVAFSFSIVHDAINSRNELRNVMQFNTHLMAENSKSPLLFSDTSGAMELLSSFRSMPMVLNATLFNDHDSVFAHYTNDDTCKNSYGISGIDTTYFNQSGLHISKRIVQENQLFGTLAVHVSTLETKRKFELNLLAFLAGLIIITIASCYMALKLQRIISGPILELKDLAERITHESDYSMRIPHTRHNEIGLLQTSLDLMVQQQHKNILSLKNEIDDRIRSQHEAQQLRMYLQNIIDSISLLIIAVDAEGNIRQVNQATARFFKRNSDEFLHLPVDAAIPLLKGKEIFIKTCIKENLSQKTPISYMHPETNATMNLELATFPLSLVEKEGIVLVIENVTEKNRMETMMIQSEKMASVGGLAAGMAHEINNPLGIISQGIQNIIRHVSPEEPRNKEIAAGLNLDITVVATYLEQRKVLRYLHGMLDASKRASEIVANMLQFSRMSIQSKSTANITEIIGNTIELASNDYELKKKYDFRQIKMATDYAANLPLINCNVTEIQQVLLNLFKNAAHALYDKRAEGFEPMITVRANSTATHLHLEIEDNGSGIPESIRKRVFEPFFTTKEVGVGTGLGLSVSFFIITKNHSGTIELESQAGVGTKFIIELPYCG